VSGAAPPADGTLKVTGTIRLPDGSPAANAYVSFFGDLNIGVFDASTRADAEGRFELAGWNPYTARLHFRSSDSRHQATLLVYAQDARAKFARPLDVQLAPAERHVVTVLADGKPVTGAHVVAIGEVVYRVSGQTGADGKAELLVPSQERLNELVAWHPNLGVAGVRRLAERPKQTASEFTLLRPAPLTIRVVDLAGKPLANLPISAHVPTDAAEWIMTGYVDAAHARTDDNGEVVLPWVPAEGLRYLEVDVLAPHFKVDETSRDQLDKRLAVVQVRREIPVEGRLIMPEGASAAGILITGFGFGPTNSGDIPVVRARADGSFTLYACSDHGYAIGVSDTEWASDVWSGLILASDTAKPADVTLKFYRATPTTIRVTRGPDRLPVAEAWIYTRTEHSFAWTDAKGEKRNAGGGPRAWLRTNAEGVAQIGFGRGEYEVRIQAGTWNEARKIQVSTEEPMQVDLHREWLADRTLVGRLSHRGERYRPSANAEVKVWSSDESSQSELLTPKPREDGTIEFSLDVREISMLVTDLEHGLSGFARIKPTGDTFELEMVPMAEFAGAVVDADTGMSLGRVRLRLSVNDALTRSGEVWAANEVLTDDNGRFHFDSVPAAVPLSLRVDDPKSSNNRSLLFEDKLFSPGEVRTDERLLVRSGPGPSRRMSLAEILARTVRDARLCGMRTLVILQPDATAATQKLTNLLLNTDQHKEILSYRPVVVASPVNEADVAMLSQNGWELPGAEVVTLMALDGQGKALDTARVPLVDAEIAFELASDFVKRNVPPKRDARAMLAAAREEAKRSGRRVWIVYGGPRCGPCFRLARWMDDQHELIEKDYVVMKFLEVIDTNAFELAKELPMKPGDGIPWMAITEPDGTILATSDGPLGNIGFPSELESRRHFREMLDRTAQRLTADERDRLIQSLEPSK
jgi:hypothetical protein